MTVLFGDDLTLTQAYLGAKTVTLHNSMCKSRDVKPTSWGTFLEELLKNFSYEAALLHLYDTNAERLNLAAVYGIKSKYSRLCTKLQTDKTIIGDALATREVHVATKEELGTDTMLFHIHPRSAAAMAIPLLNDERLVGVVTLYESHRELFDLDEASHVLRLANELLQASLNQQNLARLNGSFGRLDDVWPLHVMTTDAADCETELPPSTEVQDRLQRNASFLKTTRTFVKTLLQHSPAGYNVMVVDVDGVLLDHMGDKDLKTACLEQGLRIGSSFYHPRYGRTALREALETGRQEILHGPDHTVPAYQEWSCAAAPILVGPDTRCIGAIAILVDQPMLPNYIVPLLQAISIGVAQGCELDDYQQNLSRVYHGLLSQLDYHFILLDEDRFISEERHPIPISREACEAMRIITRTGECNDYELTIEGRAYLVDVRFLRDHTGTTRAILGLFKDITQRKEYELRLRDIERLSTLTSLSAGIAHEIRNPLTTARGFLQLFGQRISSPEDREFVNLTIQELDRIQLLLRDFMGIARPEQSHLELVDVCKIIQEVTTFLCPEASLKNVLLESDCSMNLALVHGDAGRLKQVFMNILQNAVHACGEKGHVLVRVTGNESLVSVSVLDNGCGISDTAQLFRPFFTTKSTGTGLGLVVSKNIVEEHGGRIEVSSSEGQGTCVTINLPSST